jgi:peroxiredoxin
VQALIIDVMETPEVTKGWVEKSKYTIPVLLDADGRVAEAYAPAGVLPDLPRNQVPIASNLIIDREGKIQFFSLLDTAAFDARLVALQSRLEELLEEK